MIEQMLSQIHVDTYYWVSKTEHIYEEGLIGNNYIFQLLCFIYLPTITMTSHQNKFQKNRNVIQSISK